MALQSAADPERGDVKTNFDRIYVQADPREYFRVLYGLDYIIPNLARSVFRTLVDVIARKRRRRLKVLDLGCSYGINSALLRYPVEIDRLAMRYGDLQAIGLSADELMVLDRHYFQAWPREVDVEIIGLDVSPAAINYALRVGLLDHGFAENLEESEPSAELAAQLEDVDLIISTGCVGYVTDVTFRRLLQGVKSTVPWVASFALRLYPFDSIAACLAGAGIETEKLESVTFVQRRFHSEREYAETITTLERLGIDTTGKEADGLLHAELWVSRPRAEQALLPIQSIVSVTSGANRSFGRRYQRHADDKIRLVR